MTAIVIDASVTAPLLLPDEYHEVAAAVAAAVLRREAVAPWLWWFEVRNLLVVNERRGRISRALADEAWDSVRNLAVQLNTDPLAENILLLARRHNLTVYDAAYLELALRFAAPLATLDGRLAAAARSEGVALVGGE